MIENDKVGTLPELLAFRVGLARRPGDPEGPSPTTMLGWAIHWAEKGLHLFPCRSFLGTPLVSKWYREATDNVSRLVEWWSETPDADIAAVPDLSGHFVLQAVGAEGLSSLDKLESEYGTLTPLFSIETKCASRHLWFNGRAMTIHNGLGPGLHVCGPGTFVYMPASLAPDPE